MVMLAANWRCSSKKEQAQATQHQDSVHFQKSQIKSFWQAYRKAQDLRVAGNWQEAASYYEKALTLDSLHENTRFNLGNMYLELGKYDQAARCWQQILKHNPQSAKSYMQLGRLYLTDSQPDFFTLDKATKMFSQALAINKMITAPQLYLGKIKLLEGQTAQAEKYFLAVIATDEKNIEAAFLLGYVSWNNKHFSDAENYFNKATVDAKSKVKPKKELVEGDTKGGVSHLRSTHTTLFGSMFEDMARIEKPDRHLMNQRYLSVQKKIESVRHTYHL